jgi:hypothetical protein
VEEIYDKYKALLDHYHHSEAEDAQLRASEAELMRVTTEAESQLAKIHLLRTVREQRTAELLRPIRDERNRLQAGVDEAIVEVGQSERAYEALEEHKARLSEGVLGQRGKKRERPEEVREKLHAFISNEDVAGVVEVLHRKDPSLVRPPSSSDSLPPRQTSPTEYTEAHSEESEHTGLPFSDTSESPPPSVPSSPPSTSSSTFSSSPIGRDEFDFENSSSSPAPPLENLPLSFFICESEKARTYFPLVTSYIEQSIKQNSLEDKAPCFLHFYRDQLDECRPWCLAFWEEPGPTWSVIADMEALLEYKSDAKERTKDNRKRKRSDADAEGEPEEDVAHSARWVRRR